MEYAISDGLNISSSVLVMFGLICSALHFHSGWYYFFDSHSHGKNGLSCPTGTSILIGFSNIDGLVTYLYAHYTSMCINLESQFEVLPVLFTFFLFLFFIYICFPARVCLHHNY